MKLTDGERRSVMADPILSGIYKIAHVPSGKCYVGSAARLSKRWSQHRSTLIKGCHHSIHLQRAWNKWGAYAFEFSVLEYVGNKEDLILHEQYWIDTLKSACCGYNICAVAGSRLGRKQPPEAIAKTAAANRGKKRSRESRAKMSAWQIGRKLSKEHGEKIAASNRNRIVSAATRAKNSAANKGKILSQEHRAKISASSVGKIITAETREKLSAAVSGLRHTAEARAKISAAGMGRVMSAEVIAKRVATRARNKAARQIAASPE